MKLILPSPILNAILTHCGREMPREAVGLLASPYEFEPYAEGEHVVQAVASAHNRSSTPETAFYVDPHEQWKIERALYGSGLFVIGSYHSHPTKDAQPSGMDCEFMGDRVMLIVSMPSAFRAWREVDGHTEEVELEIMPVPRAIAA